LANLYDQSDWSFALFQREGSHAEFVVHDPSSSVAGVYDIWRTTDQVSGNDTSSTPGDIVFVELYLGDDGQSLGFPKQLLYDFLIQTRTVSGNPSFNSFIFWHGVAGPYQVLADLSAVVKGLSQRTVVPVPQALVREIVQ
jgi:hypothetical protein